MSGESIGSSMDKFGISFDGKVYSVTDLNLFVKSLLLRTDELHDILVRGEISNFTHYDDRHMYFSLKDDKSEINCVMFRGDNKDLEFQPEEGIEVLCRGSVTVYPPRGRYQVVVKEMYPGGMGKLYLAFQQLKEKLEEEGLFSEELKKPLPFLPRKIGIVTSREAAALRDVISVLRRRFPNIDILLAHTPVQGKGAEEEIAEKIKMIDRKDVDVIIVTRGGGSIEDLWCFNEEVVARAIFEAEKPVISAVGHETDFLISDFVADVRAPTPSAAAETVVPVKEELETILSNDLNRAENALKNIIQDLKIRLGHVATSSVFKNPMILIEEEFQRLDEVTIQLDRNIRDLIKGYSQRLESQEHRLRALSPEAVLERGYSIVTDGVGEVIESVDDVGVGDLLEVKMKDGDIDVEVKDVKRCQKKK